MKNIGIKEKINIGVITLGAHHWGQTLINKLTHCWVTLGSDPNQYVIIYKLEFDFNKLSNNMLLFID